MKGMDGYELTAAIAARCRSVRILILSMHDKAPFSRARGAAAGHPGAANKEIAQKLSIAFKTVEAHRLNAREKLGLGTAAECRAYADEQGWS